MTVQLVDYHRKVRIGPPNDAAGQTLFHLGATSMVYDIATGRRVGVYVDDAFSSDPHEARVLQRAALEALLATGTAGEIIAGIASGSGRPFRIPGVTDAVEVYPYGSGAPLDAFFPLPKPKPGHPLGYIVQHHFNFERRRPPTRKQASELLERVKSIQGAALIWLF